MYTFKDLEDKRVLVTGGSSGIGRAVALAFSDQGATVTILSRNKSKLDAVLAKMSKKGFAVAANLMDPEQCVSAVKQAVDYMGGLDVVVNNGAPGYEGMVAEDDMLTRMYQLHVKSTMAITKAALPELQKCKGVIVNISSIAGQVAYSKDPEYGAAKAAQDHLTRYLARDYAPLGVRVNSVSPGPIYTEAYDEWAARDNADLGELLGRIAGTTALGRMGRPEDIAAAVLFLSSSASSYTTGIVHVVDGGASVMAKHP